MFSTDPAVEMFWMRPAPMGRVCGQAIDDGEIIPLLAAREKFQADVGQRRRPIVERHRHPRERQHGKKDGRLHAAGGLARQFQHALQALFSQQAHGVLQVVTSFPQSGIRPRGQSGKWVGANMMDPAGSCRGMQSAGRLGQIHIARNTPAA